ncbi:MAG TPA: acyl-CoA dehydrogenase [Caldithrix abyssi]|uniref:Acyl-CoA dehydrogenase n=1 Tax=Caldithrix abyssi TaxID=187145 RepID=A0A7V4TZN4_CALAY|nr:acyl-CoA dehydrogenase [Caldithrix abyssi]
MEIQLSQEEISEFAGLAGKFAQSSLRSYLNPEFSDGEIERLPQILEEARKTGLLADAENSYGVWGFDLNAHPDVSLKLLTILAEVCGGAAMCFHQNGLAFNILHFLSSPPSELSFRTVAVALQESHTIPHVESILKNTSAPVFETQVVRGENGQWLLRGAKRFVYSLPGNEAYLVFVQDGDEPAAALLPADSPGMKIKPLEPRLGLAACRVEYLILEDVLLEENRIFRGKEVGAALLRTLFIQWLGISAIAVGIGRGALKAAGKYAGERYQGGTTIENHPAVQRLLSGSEENIVSAEAQLNQKWRLDAMDTNSLRKAATTKRSVTRLCTQAVSDALQCFGGYGYMEDYGMEKRFRDVHTLKAMVGSPFYLQRLIHHWGGEA